MVILDHQKGTLVIKEVILEERALSYHKLSFSCGEPIYQRIGRFRFWYEPALGIHIGNKFMQCLLMATPAGWLGFEG